MEEPGEEYPRLGDETGKSLGIRGWRRGQDTGLQQTRGRVGGAELRGRGREVTQRWMRSLEFKGSGRPLRVEGDESLPYVHS